MRTSLQDSCVLLKRLEDTVCLSAVSRVLNYFLLGFQSNHRDCASEQTLCNHMTKTQAEKSNAKQKLLSQFSCSATGLPD